MLPRFGSDGHFLIDAAEGVPIWSPLVNSLTSSPSAAGLIRYDWDLWPT